MSKTLRATVAAALAAATLAAPAAAIAAPSNPCANSNRNWGQEVRCANQTEGYGEGNTRGDYVPGHAQDGDGPGYGREIHDLANPGQSNPRSDNF